MTKRGKGRRRWVAGAAVLAIALAAVGVALRPAGVPLFDTQQPPAPDTIPPVGEDAPGQTVPSGQPVTYQEAILEPQTDGEAVLRLRFIAPRIGEGPGRVPFAEAADDMAFLCREVGIAVAGRAEPQASRIIVALSAEETEFGRSYPDVVQFFEQYRIDGDDCIWEDY